MKKHPITQTDYHMHTTFSPDADHTPEAMCRQALALGLTEIAFTEHAEWHPKMSLGGLPRLAEYLAEVEACRVKFGPLGLQIYVGVELGNPHLYAKEATTLLAKNRFEVVLASLHWLDDENIHDAACFAGRDPDEVYSDYFAELGRMVMNFEFDIVAHFDRILWRGTLLGTPLEPRWLEPEIRETLAIIARYDRVLELNAAFLAREPHWRPTLVTLFRWFREEGGRRVVINSDSHRIGEIGRNRALAEQILEKAGFQLPEQLFRVRAQLEVTPT
jgi:histidinol-phosphatase (PHP family)